MKPVRQRLSRSIGFAGTTLLPVALLVLGGCSNPAESTGSAARKSGADVKPDGEMHVYFGDLHLHTAYSLDAATVQTQITPDQSYQFAKGEEVDYFGKPLKRTTPLDFLAVTDHAEYLGNVRLAKTGKITLLGDDWQPLYDNDGGQPMRDFMNRTIGGIYGESMPGLSNPALVQGNWQDIIAAAEKNYEPGKFTTFVAFEYSASFRGATRGQMHRNVIFRGPDYPAMPFGATDSLHAEALWSYAEANRERGIDSLMIPHNSNLSNGMQFALEDTWGKPIDADYARRRAANEPLMEVTQAKGTSETRPELSPDDEFADFELMGGSAARMPGSADLSTAPGQLAGSYLRTGLLRGLQLAEKTGVNPYELGFVGASDFHSGVSASEEDNFPGGHGLHDLQRNPQQVIQEIDAFLGAKLTTLSASGITGVWAPVNTREAIFDALRRRESFATSGPQIRVRIFGGWSEPGEMLAAADWDKQARAWGVPMGGNLRAADRNGAAPSFVFQAAKDPASGNLDRIQIIKLWRDGSGSHEKIFDVVWSEGRTRDARTGRLQPVGNTVNAATATYTNTIGAAELAGSWTDPEFDATAQAIYYARVIEIPTPRWDTYLAARNGVTQPADAKLWLQERAWTSPIYYTP